MLIVTWAGERTFILGCPGYRHGKLSQCGRYAICNSCKIMAHRSPTANGRMDVPFIHGVFLWCSMDQAEQLSKNLTSRIKLMPYICLISVVAALQPSPHYICCLRGKRTLLCFILQRASKLSIRTAAVWISHFKVCKLLKVHPISPSANSHPSSTQDN